jgi:signal transduction histidine kinase
MEYARHPAYYYVSAVCHRLYKIQSLNDNYYILIIIAMAGACLLVVLFILLQIRSQNRLLRQQKKMQETELHHQKELLHTVILSQEKERNRIGMDLHDEVGTVLSSLRMTIESFPDNTPMTTVPGSLSSHCKYIIDKVIVNVRGIAHNLSPFTGGVYGFTDALEDLCEHINRSEKIAISLQHPADGTFPQLPETTALALYRVIAELINNTVKHANAENIVLSFEMNDPWLQVDYKDDGSGFIADGVKKGMGMRNIESRLGMIGATYAMTTESNSGFGLRIKIFVH